MHGDAFFWFSYTGEKYCNFHSDGLKIGIHFTCVAMNKSLILGDIQSQIRLHRLPRVDLHSVRHL